MFLFLHEMREYFIFQVTKKSNLMMVLWIVPKLKCESTCIGGDIMIVHRPAWVFYLELPVVMCVFIKLNKITCWQIIGGGGPRNIMLILSNDIVIFAG